MLQKFRLFVRRLLGKEISEWALRIRRDDLRVEKFLKKTLSGDSNCIDIGAHNGSFLDFFTTIAPSGSHFAFEPLKDYYNKLLLNYQNVRIYNLALSNQSGEAVFYVAKGAEAMSGLKKQDYPGEVELIENKVEVRELDFILDQADSIDFIKIDVEGAELQVLEGGSAIIDKFRPHIMFEYALLHARNYDVNPGDIFDFFYNRRYQLSLLDGSVIQSAGEFELIANTAERTNYDRRAETNFLAIPVG